MNIYLSLVVFLWGLLHYLLVARDPMDFRLSVERVVVVYWFLTSIAIGLAETLINYRIENDMISAVVVVSIFAAGLIISSTLIGRVRERKVRGNSRRACEELGVGEYGVKSQKPSVDGVQNGLALGRSVVPGKGD